MPVAVLVSHYLGADGLNVNMVWQIKFWYKLQELQESLIYIDNLIEINFWKAAGYQANKPARNEWVLVPARGRCPDLPCFHGDLHGDLLSDLHGDLLHDLLQVCCTICCTICCRFAARKR